MLSAIIFDFDGVIVETEMLHYQATLAALRDDKVNFNYDVYREKYIGVPDVLMFPLIGERYGIHVHDVKLEGLLAKKRRAYYEMDLGKLPVCPGVLELVQAAYKQIPLAICTGAHQVDLDQILPELAGGELMRYFQRIVTSDDVRHPKPNPEGYLLSAQCLKVDPENCLVIEDTPVGISAAKAAGMTVLGVCTSFHSSALQDADRVVHRLSDINFFGKK